MSLNPVTVVLCVCLFDFIFLSIYLLSIDIIHNHFQTIWVAEYRFNDSKQFIPYWVDTFSGSSHMRFRV